MSAEGKVAIIRMATDAGFYARDAGSLKTARYIEALAYLNIQYGNMLGQSKQIAPIWLSR